MGESFRLSKHLPSLNKSKEDGHVRCSEVENKTPKLSSTGDGLFKPVTKTERCRSLILSPWFSCQITSYWSVIQVWGDIYTGPKHLSFPRGWTQHTIFPEVIGEPKLMRPAHQRKKTSKCFLSCLCFSFEMSLFFPLIKINGGEKEDLSSQLLSLKWINFFFLRMQMWRKNELSQIPQLHF